MLTIFAIHDFNQPDTIKTLFASEAYVLYNVTMGGQGWRVSLLQSK